MPERVTRRCSCHGFASSQVCEQTIPIRAEQDERRVTEDERRSAAMRMTRKRVAEPGAEEVERYAGAFARVRLVRAWIAAAAAMVAMLYAYVALLERVVR